MSNKEIEMQDKIDKFKAMNDEMYQHIVMLQEHKAFADNIIEQYATKCKMYEEHIAELEKQLENAFVPKFNLGQEIWETKPLMAWKVKKIEWQKFDDGYGDTALEIYRLGHDGNDDYNCCLMPQDNDRFFATKEEAQAKGSDNEELVSKLDIAEQEEALLNNFDETELGEQEEAL